MVVDLADQPRFFVRATMGLGISKVVSLAIGKAVSTGTDVAIGFSGLFLW